MRSWWARLSGVEPPRWAPGASRPTGRRRPTDVSANWAGYAVTSPSTTFTSVTATWRQPRPSTASQSGAGSASAFWVGLGGYDSRLRGARADRHLGRLRLADRQADLLRLVRARAEPVGDDQGPEGLAGRSRSPPRSTSSPPDTVLVQVKNRTRKTSFTKKLTFANPDLTSAEWIAEAPSACNSFRCRTLPLSDFGSVRVHPDRRDRQRRRRDADRESRVDDDRDHARRERKPRLLPRARRGSPARARRRPARARRRRPPTAGASPSSGRPTRPPRSGGRRVV